MISSFRFDNPIIERNNLISKFVILKYNFHKFGFPKYSLVSAKVIKGLR